MSEFDQPTKQRREDLLAGLKAKRTGGTSPLNMIPPTSPDASVLVPSSSSPVAPSRPSTSKFFNPPGVRPQPFPVSQSSTSTIPSSRLGFGANDVEAAAGTPASVVSAINRRHEEPTSPSSPQPLSRLKKRYDEDTPIKASAGHTPSSPLVAAARQDQGTKEGQMVARMHTQFNNVPIDQIRDIVRRNIGDLDRAVNEIQWLSSNKSFSSSSTPGAISRQGSSTSVALPVEDDSILLPRPKKGKKNEMSRIYANRNPMADSTASVAPSATSSKSGKTKPRRKDPDESESEAEAGGAGSEAESEMDWSGDEGRRRKKRKGNEDEDEVDAEGAALRAFNTVSLEELTGTIACSEDQAKKIIGLRPFADVDEVHTKLTKARGVSNKLFEQYTEIMEGYVQIDACLNRCEAIASDVANTLSVWRGASMAHDSVIGTPRSDGLNDVKVDVNKVSELLKNETDMRKRKILSRYIQIQPALLSEGTILKDYQLLGVNWLNLLYTKQIGCILADEMGLGKTIQVIAFLAHLKEKKIKGPHMIYVPASTLENWIREFDKFCPDIDVQTYYGSQAERAALRDDLKRRYRSGRLEVVLASYTQVAAADDLHFFRKKIEFETCIYDEGHRLKSCTTKAYQDLMMIKPKWRLLLTGTPLQNNLQELVSLLMFIHKDTFTDAEQYLRAIFKSQGASVLSQQRVSRARTMLTPFVLRRRKAHVLTLPPKIETVQHCEMTPVQAKLYRETLGRSKKVLEELDDNALEEAAAEDDVANNTGKAANGKAKKGKKAETKVADNSSSHILMDLRKAASHPLLFRRHYTDARLKQLARACLNTPQWCDSNYDYVVEDLQIMSDAEISHFCTQADFDNVRKFALDPKVFLEGGKVAALQKHIERCKAEGKRMLLFSQFVMILDILQVALDHLNVRYTRLDGQTRTDERQGLVDEFTDDQDITVFLLSTKAGGVGINLTAASVVIIYDQDFNPHNDRQAADRAYRIGQEKEVEVIKLITKDSIDEDMFAIGMTKLQLDDAVGGEEVSLEVDGGAPKDDKTAKEVRKSLLTTLRNKFEAAPGDAIKEEVEIETEEMTPAKKVARGTTQSQVPVTTEIRGEVEAEEAKPDVDEKPAAKKRTRGAK